MKPGFKHIFSIARSSERSIKCSIKCSIEHLIKRSIEHSIECMIELRVGIDLLGHVAAGNEDDGGSFRLSRQYVEVALQLDALNGTSTRSIG